LLVAYVTIYMNAKQIETAKIKVVWVYLDCSLCLFRL